MMMILRGGDVIVRENTRTDEEATTRRDNTCVYLHSVRAL